MTEDVKKYTILENPIHNPNRGWYYERRCLDERRERKLDKSPTTGHPISFTMEVDRDHQLKVKNYFSHYYSNYEKIIKETIDLNLRNEFHTKENCDFFMENSKELCKKIYERMHAKLRIEMNKANKFVEVVKKTEDDIIYYEDKMKQVKKEYKNEKLLIKKNEMEVTNRKNLLEKLVMSTLYDKEDYEHVHYLQTAYSQFIKGNKSDTKTFPTLKAILENSYEANVNYLQKLNSEDDKPNEVAKQINLNLEELKKKDEYIHVFQGIVKYRENLEVQKKIDINMKFYPEEFVEEPTNPNFMSSKQIKLDKPLSEHDSSEKDDDYQDGDVSEEEGSVYINPDDYVMQENNIYGDIPYDPWTELIDYYLEKDDNRPKKWEEHLYLKNAHIKRKDVSLQYEYILDNEANWKASQRPIKNFLNKVELKKLPFETTIEKKMEKDVEVSNVVDVAPPFEMNTNYVSFAYENGHYVGLGLAFKQQDNMFSIDKFNTIWRFNWNEAYRIDAENKKKGLNDMSKAWEKFKLNVSEEANTYLQSPLTCVIDDHLYMYGGYINKNKQYNELQKLYLNYRNKEATWQIVEFEDCEQTVDKNGAVEVYNAGYRSHSRKMIHVKDKARDEEFLYFYGGVREIEGKVIALNDLKRFNLKKNVVVEHICNVNPGRGCHFFEKCNDNQFLLGLGYDFNNVVPLNDFILYERSTNIHYSIFLEYDFQPEYNFTWAEFMDNRFILIFGGKIQGMLFIIDKENLSRSYLAYSSAISKTSEAPQVAKISTNSSYYPLDFFEKYADYMVYPETFKDADNYLKNTTLVKDTKEAKKEESEMNKVFEQDFRQDRGGIMVFTKKDKPAKCKRVSTIPIVREQPTPKESISSIELWALPCYLHRNQIRKYEMCISYDKEIPVDTYTYGEDNTFWNNNLYKDLGAMNSDKTTLNTIKEIDVLNYIAKNKKKSDKK